ncbi:MAG: 16S rRNA (cytosine(1402)-N(4))-methyltransferase RsmH [Erysipelotrichaceae bacterium]
MMKHFSVLLQESIDSLNIKPDGIYVDCTLGRAGHAKEILKRIPKGHLYAFDKDHKALEDSAAILSGIAENFTLIHSDYSNISSELKKFDVKKVDGILMDIGVSSPQFDESERGFSYRFDARLDMRMDTSQKLDAHYIINNYEKEDLLRILKEYGEEKFANSIANNIIKYRPINSTFELVEIIKNSLPNKELKKKGHPAKQTFQAIRIEVNNELEGLKLALEQTLSLLAENGRLAIITFHSLEDRIVKRKFKEVSEIKLDKHLIIKAAEYPKADFKLINKKPILANSAELEDNNRSHSAKLRVIERV